MGKRTIGELAPEEDVSLKSETPSRKKSKKDKSRKRDVSTGPATVAEDPVNGNKPDESLLEGKAKLSKEERRAAKKAKKEAKETKRAGKAGTVPTITPGETSTASTGEDEDPDAAKAARKAALKAEKKRLKRLAKGEDSDITTDTAPASAFTSAVPSTAQSSATSLEVTPTPKTDHLRYMEDPVLTSLPQSEINDFLAEHYISIDDPKPPIKPFRPITKFSYLPITDEAQRRPFASFTSPTPIQAAAWPSLLAGRDVIGVAETGSGKTMAFGVPCIQHILSLPKKQQRGVKAVIVSPTRELAAQIYEQLVTLAQPAGLEVVCVYGGVPKDPQVKAVRKANIVVATPGRLNDLIGDGSADLSAASYVVLDEADRMLDKGFEEAIRQIIGETAKRRQTLMFTATWPPSVRELAATFMQLPVKISIGDNPSGELRANTRIQQIVEVIDPYNKDSRLFDLLKKYQSGSKKDDRILVFCLYKKEAVRVEQSIQRRGFRVAGIHGDLSQERRTASLEAFKRGEVPLLVATDVAARGLDIPAVKVVINVTFPLTVEDYVHRIGRTGRAGKEGLAITFFTEHDKAQSGALINVLKAANQPVPEALLKFGTTVKKKVNDNYGVWSKDVDMTKKGTKISFD